MPRDQMLKVARALIHRAKNDTDREACLRQFIYTLRLVERTAKPRVPK